MKIEVTRFNSEVVMSTSPSRVLPAVQSSAASPTSTDPARRRFLVTLGAGSATAAAALTALPAAATAVAPAVPADDDSVSKYRETTHVRDYYRTTRL
jgi:hypothetical protein